MSSVFTLCNSAIGAGVLSLPFAFRRAGWAGCLLMCLTLGSMEAFTLYVLSKFAERYRGPHLWKADTQSARQKAWSLLVHHNADVLMGLLHRIFWSSLATPSIPSWSLP
eukprot:jgi/Botrbrau1/19788/Bobra.0124s0036.1